MATPDFFFEVDHSLIPYDAGARLIQIDTPNIRMIISEESYDEARENYRYHDLTADPDFLTQVENGVGYGGVISFELYGMSWLATRIAHHVYTLTNDDGAADEHAYLTGLDDEEFTA